MSSLIFADGQIRLYKRPRSNMWQANILGTRISCKTTDQEQALALAREELVRAKLRIEEGIEVPKKHELFSAVSASYLEWLELQVASGARNKRYFRDRKYAITKYFNPFFGSRKISRITSLDIEKYIQWRLTYYVSGPGADGVRRYKTKSGKQIEYKRHPHQGYLNNGELGVLRAVFDRGVMLGLLTEADKPKIKAPKRSANLDADTSRPAFTPDQFAQLINGAFAQATTKKRRMLYYYIGIMGNTGIRPGTEHQSLRWRHITEHVLSNGVRVPKILITKSKVGRKKKNKSCIGNPEALEFFNQLRAWSKFNKPDDFVFCNQKDGRVIKSFYGGFVELCNQLGMSRDAEGKLFTPYSLRHTYATNTLLSGSMNVGQLAKNMRTSAAMIERHYDHVTIDDIAESAFGGLQ